MDWKLKAVECVADMIVVMVLTAGMLVFGYETKVALPIVVAYYIFIEALKKSKVNKVEITVKELGDVKESHNDNSVHPTNS
jgi:hypothetical protein